MTRHHIYVFALDGQELQKSHQELRIGTTDGYFIISKKTWDYMITEKNLPIVGCRYDDSTLKLTTPLLTSLRSYIHWQYIRIKNLFKKGA